MIVVASIVVSALESLAFVITVIGNLIVIYVMTREKMLLRKSNIYILSVAFADLLMGLMGVPMSILNANDNRPYNYQLCLYLTCTSVFLCMTAIISLIAVTVDRYRAICHPIAYRSATGTFSTKCIVGLCYALGLLIGFLPALGWRNEEFNGKCFILTTMPFDYILLCTVFTCFGTISVMLVLYGCILYTVCKLERKRRLQISTGHDSLQIDDNSVMNKNEVRVAKTFALIIGSFIIFWTPLTIMGTIVAFKRDSHYFDNDESARIWFMFAACAAHFNSAIDPIIYAYRIKDVRVIIKRLFKCGR